MTLTLPKVNLNKYRLFTIFALFWVGLDCLGLILAMAGFFHVSILAAYVIFGLVIFSFLLARNRTKISIDKNILILTLLSLLAILIFSAYSVPTIFSGRDQGSLSEAAIQLSKNRDLTFSFPAEKEFFKIYGQGPALNFPGFNYTATGELTTQFPLGYIAWLAIFYSFFGLSGFAIANGISFMLFIVSFYLIARTFLRPSRAALAWILIMTSFVFSWFFKFTLSENLALMLLWFGIFSFLQFRKNQERFYLLSSLFAFIILTFTRIEAFAFLFVILIILFWKNKNWKQLLLSTIGKKFLLVPIALSLLYLANQLMHTQSLYVLLKNIFHPLIALGTSLNDHAAPGATSFWETPAYVIKILFSYSILSLILFGLVGCIRLWKEKKYELLLLFLIVLPSFIYLIYPSISADHPWMLRRFVFSVIPVSIIYGVWFLDRFFNKKIYFYALSALMILSNLSISLPYLTVSPNKNLLPQIKELSQDFKDSDLILIDRNATGDNWSMMTGPLVSQFGLQAVYFFNPEDLAKIDREKFSAIYLIIPDTEIEYYQKNRLLEKMQIVKDYKIENEALKVAIGKKRDLYSAPFELPQNTKTVTYGKIYLLTGK